MGYYVILILLILHSNYFKFHQTLMTNVFSLVEWSFTGIGLLRLYKLFYNFQGSAVPPSPPSSPSNGAPTPPPSDPSVFRARNLQERIPQEVGAQREEEQRAVQADAIGPLLGRVLGSRSGSWTGLNIFTLLLLFTSTFKYQVNFYALNRNL